MHFVRIRIGKVPPFTESVEFMLNEQVNLFVGPNASGKSTVLMVLANELIGKEDKPKRPIGEGEHRVHTMMISDAEIGDDWVQELASSERDVILTTSVDRDDISNPQDYMPVIHIGSVREGLPGISEAKDLDALYDAAIEEVLEEQFSGVNTVRACNLLAKELWSTDKDELPKYARVIFMRAIELADACSKKICDEVIRDSRTHNYIPGIDIRDYLHHPHAPANTIDVMRMMAINTNDTRNFNHLSRWEKPSYAAYHEDPSEIPLYLGHLSSGTEGTLLWIRWLALKMLHYYEFAKDWNEQPAILLIDEIENHLHPTWQRRVIPALLEHFPGLQIFATTHSPFVVAGLKAGQVHMLKRDADGVVSAMTNKEAIEGWTADEILRVYMGVDDPTDQDTAEAAAQLRKLRDEGPSADEREEEERQAEIRRLRQIVDRAELSGPRAAEDDRFLANLDAILERHRESQNLNQENG
ncbi:MAG: AAA family ATPase [Chloroflexi bacterium]|nr:AAA family ATPase [Chloroflexota bacterium]